MAEGEEIQSQEGTSQEQGNPAVEQSLVDLDGVERFKFAGREWKPDELKNSYMMHSDYTRKTQEIASERKYFDNLSYDLDKVRGNPALAEEFKKVYPEKFHAYLRYVHQEQKAGAVQGQSADPQLMSRLESIEKALHEKEVQSIEAKLDLTFNKLSQKYPMADQGVVISLATSLADKGQKIDDAMWDKIFKAANDRIQGLAEKHYKTKVTNQIEANRRGKDSAAGGGIPGQAPQKLKMKDVAQTIINDLTRARAS